MLRHVGSQLRAGPMRAAATIIALAAVVGVLAFALVSVVQVRTPPDGAAADVVAGPAASPTGGPAAPITRPAANPRHVVQAQLVQPRPPIRPDNSRPGEIGPAGSALRRQVEREAAQTQPATFRIATFNLLGASHTANGGRGGRYAGGAARMGMAVGQLTSRGITVAGLQELQAPQFAVLRARLPSWGVYPGGTLSRGSMANSIIWNPEVWQLVETHTINIPYFFGRPVAMPYIKLRHVGTGAEVWFGNFHNPANAYGNAQAWRDRAVQLELDLARNLSADGTPLIFTGDMNDRAPYFCPSTADGTLHSASGGTTGVRCRMPARTRVDWVMGTDAVEFSSYTEVDGGIMDQITDHPLVYSDATVPPQPLGDASDAP